MILLQTSLARLGLAALLGACMGATRPSQVRTVWIGVSALMALGSSLLTMTAFLGFTPVPGMGHVQGDPTRIVSWILIGSGLLGASSLLVQQGEGLPSPALTTAVMIWVAAMIGVLCGAGWLSEAVGGALLILSVFLIYRLVKRYFSSH